MNNTIDQLTLQQILERLYLLLLLQRRDLLLALGNHLLQILIFEGINLEQ